MLIYTMGDEMEDILSRCHIYPHDHLPEHSLWPPTKTLSGASCMTLQERAHFIATLKYRDRQITEELYAVKKLNCSLLECPVIKALGLVQRVNAVQTKTDIVKQCLKLFEAWRSWRSIR